MKLPPIQQKVYDYILAYKKEHGTEPTLEIIAKHFKVSYQAIQDHMRGLRKKGLIKARKYEPRAEYEVSTGVPC